MNDGDRPGGKKRPPQSSGSGRNNIKQSHGRPSGKKKRKKNKRVQMRFIKMIALAVLCVFVFAAVVFFISDKSGGVFIHTGSDAADEVTGLVFTVSPATVKNVEPYESGAVVLTNSSVNYIDKGGNLHFNRHNFANPVMATNGKTVLLYNKGGSEYRVEKKGEIVDLFNSSGKITCATLGKSDDYAFALDSDSGFQSHIFTYSSNGKKRFEWGSAQDYCVAMALSDSGKKLAVSLVGTSDGELYSVVKLFDFRKDEPDYSTVLPGKLIYALDFISNSKVVGFSDCGVYTFDKNGDYTDTQTYSSTEIKHSDIDIDGLRSTVISMYGNDLSPLITAFNAKNKTLYSRTYSENVYGITCDNSRVCVSLDGRIEVLNKSNKVLGKIVTDETVEKFALSDKLLYVIMADGVHAFSLSSDIVSAG